MPSDWRDTKGRRMSRSAACPTERAETEGSVRPLALAHHEGSTVIARRWGGTAQLVPRRGGALSLDVALLLSSFLFSSRRRLLCFGSIFHHVFQCSPGLLTPQKLCAADALGVFLSHPGFASFAP